LSFRAASAAPPRIHRDRHQRALADGGGEIGLPSHLEGGIGELASLLDNAGGPASQWAARSHQANQAATAVDTAGTRLRMSALRPSS